MQAKKIPRSDPKIAPRITPVSLTVSLGPPDHSLWFVVAKYPDVVILLVSVPLFNGVTVEPGATEVLLLLNGVLEVDVVKSLETFIKVVLTVVKFDVTVVETFAGVPLMTVLFSEEPVVLEKFVEIVLTVVEFFGAVVLDSFENMAVVLGLCVVKEKPGTVEFCDVELDWVVKLDTFEEVVMFVVIVDVFRGVTPLDEEFKVVEAVVIGVVSMLVAGAEDVKLPLIQLLVVCKVVVMLKLLDWTLGLIVVGLIVEVSFTWQLVQEKEMAINTTISLNLDSIVPYGVYD